MRLRIGTRGSALARAQAADVARRLEANGHTTETIVISTTGDRVTDRAFADVGAFGVFVRDIETALLDGRVDVAVHSYKDLPSRGPSELIVAAVPERVDAADLLLARPEFVDAASGSLLPLRRGARVGTSSSRRQALVRALRPDLEIGQLRGNVPTRVASLSDGRFDAIVLAAAGVLRLERADRSAAALVPASIVRSRLDPRVFVPAPTQGAVAVQVRSDATAVRAAVAAINDPRTTVALHVERQALSLADAGCTVPFGAWCESTAGGDVRLVAVLGRDDGTIARSDVTSADVDAVVANVWRELTTTVNTP